MDSRPSALHSGPELGAAGGRWSLRLGLSALIVALVFTALPDSASGYSSQLRRYPYLTDVVGSSAAVNWATDRSATTATVKWGEVGSGSCTTNTATATRTSITVNNVGEYQWSAPLAVSPDSQYCYRVYLGSSPAVDLLGTDSSPSFRSQLAPGSSQPFSFAVFGDWGDVPNANGTNPDQANLMQQIASSGVRFAVTTGDNAYPSGSQTNYGDLVQTGQSISAVFGPAFWKVPGASIPIFPAVGNHGFSSGSVHLLNWPQAGAASSSGGRYLNETYCCLNGTSSATYPSAWYAFDAGNSRFYVLEAAWSDTNIGTADSYENDYDYRWTPTSTEYQWLANDLSTHASQHKFAFFHYPVYSDQKHEHSDTFLQSAAPPQAPSSLEGLLSAHGVDIAFSGHAHIYQRNLKAHANSLPTYVTGGGGADIESIGEAGCSSVDAYGIGWSDSSNRGNRCGSAPVPTSRAQVLHFLKVSVNGSQVTVTPTNSLGQTFDQVTYASPADLSLTKSDSPDPVLAGQLLTYTLSATNNGPSSATGVTLTDNLPAGVSFDSASASQGSCSQSSGTVTCNLGTLASSATASATVNVRPQAQGTVTNNASVQASESDPNGANNQASTSTTVNLAADLSLTKSDSPDPVLAGQLLTYTLTADNDGPSSATGVTLTDDLPPNLTYESATPSQGSCSESGGRVTCDLGTLASRAIATATVKVRPQAQGTITNSASLRANEADPDGADNQASESTTVNPSADLSLTKSDSPDPVLVNELLTYTLTATNNGPSGATGVTLTDTLPAGVSFDSASASQGSCSQASGTVICNLGNLAGGATTTATVKVRPQATGTITNSASVQASESDPDSANNQASEQTAVDPGYPRPIGASPLRVPLVPAFEPCSAGTANATHEAPLTGSSCSPPTPSSSLVAVGSSSIGFARFIVLSQGQCASFDSTQCYPDVTIRFDITDVRAGSPTGLDYDPAGLTGLTATATVPDALQGEGVQITDQHNRLDSDPTDPFERSATVVPISFPVPMSCASTLDPAIGSRCDAQTTANTLVPGSAVSGKRSIWEMGQLQVFDAGDNGTRGDSDDRPFEVQGVFAP